MKHEAKKDIKYGRFALLFLAIGMVSFVFWVLATKYLCSARVETAGSDLCFDQPNQLQTLLIGVSALSFICVAVSAVAFVAKGVAAKAKGSTK
jgi:hypothetical protein